MENNIDTSPASPAPKKHSFWGEVIIFILIAVCIVLPFRYYVAEPYIVSGTSMLPTFDTGHYLIVDKITWKLFHPPQRYDVIVMIYPKDTSEDFIKRVIGLPGDTLTILNGTVTITNAAHPNGFVADDSFVTFPKTDGSDDMTITLAANQYFVMGDNRAGSYDSRYWGPLPASDVIGEPVLRLWPLNKIGFMPGGFTASSTEM